MLAEKKYLEILKEICPVGTKIYVVHVGGNEHYILLATKAKEVKDITIVVRNLLGIGKTNYNSTSLYYSQWLRETHNYVAEMLTEKLGYKIEGFKL